jgi:hypothetical protein
MNPYAAMKLHELDEERLATLTVTCIPNPLALTKRGLHRVLNALSGPICSRSC